MKPERYNHWIILFILIVTPLWFFTDLTRNPYFTQITLLNVALILSVVVVLVAALRNEVFSWRRSPLDTSLLLFFCIASVSILWALISHPVYRYSIYSETMKRWLYLVVNCYTAYFLAIHFVREENRKLYLDIAIAVGGIAAGYGILQFMGIELIWPKILNPYGVRSVSTFGNPNFLSSFLVILIPVGLHYILDDAQKWKPKAGDWLTFFTTGIILAYALSTRNNRNPSVDSVAGCFAAGCVLIAAWKLSKGKAWYMLMTFLLAGSLACTLTRSSWLGALAAVMILLAGLVIMKKLRLTTILLAIMLLVGIMLLWPKSKVPGKPSVVESVLQRVTEVKSIRKGLYSAVHQRLLIWRCALSMTEQFPVMGVGFGNFELFYPFYQGRHMVGTFYKAFRTHANNTHNEIFEILSQTGIVGFGIYALMLWVILYSAWRNRKYLFLKYGMLPLALLAGLIGMWVDNILNVSLHFAVPGFLYWWQMGILMGMLAVKERVIPVKSPRVKGMIVFLLFVCALLIVRFSFYQLAEVHFFKGFKLSKAGQVARAVPELEKARKFHRFEVNNNYELGNCYARLHEREKAVWAYEEALKSNAGYDEIYFNMGAVFLQQGNEEKAMEYYEKAISINPLTLDSYMALGNMYLKDLEKNGEKLTDLYKQALMFYRENKDIWNNQGYVYTKKGDHETALEHYAKALSIDPSFALARRNLQVALQATGRKSHPLLEIDDRLREIEALVNKKDLTGALSGVEKVLESSPAHMRAMTFKGNIQFNMGMIDDAVISFNNVLKKEPKNVMVLNNLGITYLRKGDRASALKQFDSVLSIDADNKIALENKKQILAAQQ